AERRHFLCSPHPSALRHRPRGLPRAAATLRFLAADVHASLAAYLVQRPHHGTPRVRTLHVGWLLSLALVLPLRARARGGAWRPADADRDRAGSRRAAPPG